MSTIATTIAGPKTYSAEELQALHLAMNAKAKRKKIFDNERKPVEKHDIYIFHLEKCSGSRI